MKCYTQEELQAEGWLTAHMSGSTYLLGRQPEENQLWTPWHPLKLHLTAVNPA